MIAGFLRLSLFWKIVIANAVLVGVVAAGVAAASGSGTEADSVMTFAIAAVVVAGLANAQIVRTALSPLDSLERTARLVGEGVTDARAVDSPLADKKLIGVTEVFNNMLDSLSDSRTRQRDLARRVLESEERERQRIAHELYSGTAQTLATILVHLRLAERALSDHSDEAMAPIREGLIGALEEIRGLARRLRPPELDELGVRAALEAHVRSVSDSRDMRFTFHGFPPRLSRESSLALFRIVQEAINNAALHSGARNVRVRFETADDRVVAEVADDGRGFEPAEALRSSRASLGLFGMYERAGYVGGEVSVESVPGEGTTIRVALPTGADPEGARSEKAAAAGDGSISAHGPG